MSIWQSGWRGRGAWSPTIGDEPRDGRRARGRSDGGLGHFISPRQHDPGAERPTSPNRRRGGRVMPEACFQHDDRAAGFALDSARGKDGDGVDRDGGLAPTVRSPVVGWRTFRRVSGVTPESRPQRHPR